MTDGQPVLAPRHPREPHGPRPAEDVSDRELLERFVTRHEQAAFAALVQRHGSLVLGACRRVLPDAHEAEDVFQATFLVLARKAALVPWGDSLHRWLAAVAYRLALHARGSAARRRSRETPAGTMRPAGRAAEGDGQESGPGDEWQHLPEKYHPQEDPLAEVARRELRLVLDDELRRLPEKYRAPVVLCYLQGKTNEEAAGELGWPPGSMSRRLARARALLRERLTRRGFALSTAVLALVLTALWVLRGGSPPAPPAPSNPVALAMRPFRSPSEGGQGIETALLRLAEDGKPGPGSDQEQLSGLAFQAAAVARRIQDHDPGRRQKDWQRLAGEMHRSALDLARALRTKEEDATLLAARRLSASCQKCHEVFRD
jgi:RNA polymerase sigma factor (sigma-70 family)